MFRVVATSLRRGLGVGVCVLLLSGPVVAESVTRTRDICPVQRTMLQIETKTLAEAVTELSRKTKCPILMDEGLLRGGNSIAVAGVYTPREALIRLLGNAELDVIETVQGLAVMPLTYRAAHRMDHAERM
ncbi:STN domain-containing protein [Gluconobacter sp. P1C6_b]|uniref:STN domain-containing protein n=1 Tax=Gluconobacter sp. P1C6_b TaxID=2762619 RepID=UPI001C055475|nr:STN domain-containing protein [Gluconobacter sp. P1C6_b]